MPDRELPSSPEPEIAKELISLKSMRKCSDAVLSHKYLQHRWRPLKKDMMIMTGGGRRRKCRKRS